MNSMCYYIADAKYLKRKRKRCYPVWGIALTEEAARNFKNELPTENSYVIIYAHSSYANCSAGNFAVEFLEKDEDKYFSRFIE